MVTKNSWGRKFAVFEKPPTESRLYSNYDIGIHVTNRPPPKKKMTKKSRCLGQSHPSATGKGRKPDYSHIPLGQHTKGWVAWNEH